MKKLIIPAAFAASFLLHTAKAQTVDGVRLSDIKVPYIEIKSDRAPFSGKIFIRLEFGQKVNDLDQTIIKDEDGKKMEFKSLIDCLNKLKAYGYNLFQAYSENYAPDSPRTVYVLKRE